MLRRALLTTTLPLLAVPARAATRLRAVATFSVLADMLRQVGGDDLEIASLVGPDTDVHAFQPTPREARLLAPARLLVMNGLGFEGWLNRLADAASFTGQRIVASAGVPAASDPHCWNDVARARLYVANITAGLAEADRERAAIWRERAGRYDQKLAALDAWVRAEVAKVPENQRRAIVGHRSFDSFGRAYGVEILAVRAGVHDEEPSARALADLIRLARRQNIKAVFVEHLANPALPAEIARDIGVPLGPPLYGDALSADNGPAATYEAMMRYNVGVLVAGMLRN
jgi:zinc/manganese transport system substrate-binding protein